MTKSFTRAAPGRRPPLASLSRRALGAGVLSLLLAALGCAPRPEGQDWNIVLISVDTLRADHLGLYGHDRPTSPAMDELGRAGAVFTQAICQNTNTNPSHASILSGLYPHSHGNRDNFFRMADDVPMLQEALGPAGYATAAFVSGYTLKDEICGLARGFDVYDDAFSGKERLGQHTTQRALAWLQDNSDQRFFMFFHLFDPHGPYDPPPDRPARFAPRGPAKEVAADRIPRYQRLPVGSRDSGYWTDLQLYEAKYDEEIAYADQQVATLLAELGRLGLRQRTLVILTSDHGESLDERDHLLDHGGGIGDEEIRVPLIISLPDGRFAGERFAGQVESIDIAPTVAALVGVALGDHVQGVNLVPHLERGHGDPHLEAFIETRLIPNRWRSRGYQLKPPETLKAIRRPATKLVLFPGTPRNYIEIYDLLQDPGEKIDLAASRPALREDLLADLERFLSLPRRFNEIARPDSDPETREIFRTLGYVD